jgi:Fe2+ or Zn2+ uptake regulation protein
MKQIDKRKISDVKYPIMRSTRQRSIILEVLQGITTHPTAGWIFDKVKEHCPHISLGTVYRNLNLLKKTGRIRELTFGKNTARYDGNFEPHHHIFCLECGRLEDVTCTVHPDLTKSVEEMNGYRIMSHQLEFRGICPDCLKTAEGKKDNIKH